MKNHIKKYSHAWLLGYAFIYLPWFMYLEKTVTSNYHIIYISLDDWIPFNEYFIIPYILWFFYVIGGIIYFFFTDVKSYYKLCTMLFTGMTIYLIICTVFPNGTDFRPVIDPDKNIFSSIVSLLYATDTCTNVFPSIHVYNSICVHLSIAKSEAFRKYPVIKISSFILMVSILLATVFLKQHSVLDGFGAISMAYVMYYFIYVLDESRELSGGGTSTNTT